MRSPHRGACHSARQDGDGPEVTGGSGFAPTAGGAFNQRFVHIENLDESGK